MIEIVIMSVSPYSERPKWALDHHRLQYKTTEHLIIFGMPNLRRKLKRYTGDITIPALIDGDTRLMESLQISQYVDSIGKSEKLFSTERLEEIKMLNALSEAVCDAARAIVNTRVAKSRAAQEVLLPPFIPKPLRSSLTAIAAIGVKYLDLSLDLSKKSMSQREQDARLALLEVRKQLEASREKHGSLTYFEKFSYADITLAVSMHMIKPVKGTRIERYDATRDCWTQPALAEEFADLISWRDQIYTKFRQV